MNIFTHESYLKERLRKARRLHWAGIICVFISFALSVSGTFLGSPNSSTTGSVVGALLVFLAYPFLLVGLPMWSIARANQRRLQNAPLADQLLNNQLKGLNNKYSLHHYATYSGQLIEHLLVTPSGLVVIHTSAAVGPVSCMGGPKGDKWRAQSSLFDRFTGQRPPIGNPSAALERSLEAARQLLEASGKPGVPIKGLIVFSTNPDLEVNGCAYSAVPISETKQAVRDLQGDMGSERDDSLNIASILTSEDRRRVNSALSPRLLPTPVKAASARK